MFKYFNSMSTLRNIYICVNYKGRKHKKNRCTPERYLPPAKAEKISGK